MWRSEFILRKALIRKLFHDLSETALYFKRVSFSSFSDDFVNFNLFLCNLLLNINLLALRRKRIFRLLHTKNIAAFLLRSICNHAVCVNNKIRIRPKGRVIKL